MNVLVTGSEGFIGKHLVRHIQAMGHTVWELDRRHPVLPRSLSHAGMYDRPDFVIHAAATADISSNWAPDHNRYQIWVDNIVGTYHLVETWDSMPPAVFLSSLSVYGHSRCIETSPTEATSPYAASKIAGEALIQAYAEKAWILRLGAVVGEGYHHGHIADFVRQYREKGFIEAKSNGLMSSSYVHVDDVCRMVELAISGDLSAGIRNVSGGLWNCRDTVDVMRETRDVKVSWGERASGWRGDLGFCDESGYVGGYVNGRRSVVCGVREALKGLGWND